MVPRANHKLMFKYYGPYTVVKKISDVAYQLDLPKGLTVHPVFHVLLLRQALSPGTTPLDSLPDESNLLAIPVKVLSHRWRKKSNKIVQQVLVQWVPGTDASATWDDRQELQRRFPGLQCNIPILHLDVLHLDHVHFIMASFENLAFV